MMKKWLCLLVVCCLCLCLFGCGETEEVAPPKTEESSDTDDSIVVFDSDFGYTVEYDPAVFYVLTDENSDTFGLWSESSDDALTFSLNVERVGGYSVKEFSEYITGSVESGVWSMTEADFGADQLSATTVMFNEKTDAGTLHHTVILVKNKYDIIVLETVTHDGMTKYEEQVVYDMLGTFRVR